MNNWKLLRKIAGFTLIEMLVVIAIVAVLALVVILYINPAELLRQARDSTRLSDMSTIHDALSIYQSDVSGGSLGLSGVCYIGSSVGTSTASCDLYFPSAESVATSTSIANDDTGWIPVNFTNISSGTPIPTIPVDPRGTSDPSYMYSYVSTSTSARFKLAAKMESITYGKDGNKDAVSTDSGYSDTTFETGALDL
jgi:prepilin-type N-terminal cleavage/methylation domain-containing protein